MISIVSRSERETRRLGEDLGEKLRGGERLALSGNLGSGKTMFVKGLAQGLGIRKTITSPTFVLFRPYKLRRDKTFYHFDLYRLNSKTELEELGMKEILGDPRSIVVVEWSKKAKRLLPPKTILIKFAHGAKANERKITLWSKE